MPPTSCQHRVAILQMIVRLNSRRSKSRFPVFISDAPLTQICSFSLIQTSILIQCCRSTGGGQSFWSTQGANRRSCCVTFKRTRDGYDSCGEFVGKKYRTIFPSVICIHDSFVGPRMPLNAINAPRAEDILPETIPCHRFCNHRSFFISYN